MLIMFNIFSVVDNVLSFKLIVTLTLFLRFYLSNITAHTSTTIECLDLKLK